SLFPHPIVSGLPCVMSRHRVGVVAEAQGDRPRRLWQRLEWIGGPVDRFDSQAGVSVGPGQNQQHGRRPEQPPLSPIWLPHGVSLPSILVGRPTPHLVSSSGSPSTDRNDVRGPSVDSTII